jgi:hypothetical protein
MLCFKNTSGKDNSTNGAVERKKMLKEEGWKRVISSWILTGLFYWSHNPPMEAQGGEKV